MLLKNSEYEHISYHVVSIESAKKKVPKQVYNKWLGRNCTFYEEKDDFLVKYSREFKNVNGETIPPTFFYTGYLSDFNPKEQRILRNVIEIKNKDTVIADTTII